MGQLRGGRARVPSLFRGAGDQRAGRRGDAGQASPAPGSPEAAAGWRPWRFRMSNDVWGTPSVAGDLVYV
ncbi:hypothetical protein, partial [Streptomyces sp. NPDC003697]